MKLRYWTAAAVFLGKLRPAVPGRARRNRLRERGRAGIFAVLAARVSKATHFGSWRAHLRCRPEPRKARAEVVGAPSDFLLRRALSGLGKGCVQKGVLRPRQLRGLAPLQLFRLPLRVGYGPGGAGGLEHAANRAEGGSHPAGRRAQDRSAGAGGKRSARHSAAARAQAGAAAAGGKGSARQSTSAGAEDGIAAGRRRGSHIGTSRPRPGPMSPASPRRRRGTANR